MQNIRILYSSIADLDIRLSDVQDILKKARANNAKINVCGMLYYDSKNFLQALEGKEEDVQMIYDKIAEDFRHDDIFLISKEVISKPIFSQWQMGYVGENDGVQKLLEEYQLTSKNFSKLSAEDALDILVKLSQSEEHQKNTE